MNYGIMKRRVRRVLKKLMTSETNPEVLALMFQRKVCANSDYMTYDEAAALTDPGKVNFQGNTTIIHFDELQYFTGITVINSASFQRCSKLKSLTLPSTIKSIYGTATFYGTVFDRLTILSKTPPYLDSSGAGLYSSSCPIYVPAESVDAYKVATGWKTEARRIQAIPI